MIALEIQSKRSQVNVYHLQNTWLNIAIANSKMSGMKISISIRFKHGKKLLLHMGKIEKGFNKPSKKRNNLSLKKQRKKIENNYQRINLWLEFDGKQTHQKLRPMSNPFCVESKQLSHSNGFYSILHISLLLRVFFFPPVSLACWLVFSKHRVFCIHFLNNKFHMCVYFFHARFFLEIVLFKKVPYKFKQLKIITVAIQWCEMCVHNWKLYEHRRCTWSHMGCLRSICF